MSTDLYKMIYDKVFDPNHKPVKSTPEEWKKMNEAIKDPEIREKIKPYVPLIESHAKD
jgi:hypothetical protein